MRSVAPASEPWAIVLTPAMLADSATFAETTERRYREQTPCTAKVTIERNGAPQKRAVFYTIELHEYIDGKSQNPAA